MSDQNNNFSPEEDIFQSLDDLIAETKAQINSEPGEALNPAFHRADGFPTEPQKEAFPVEPPAEVRPEVPREKVLPEESEPVPTVPEDFEPDFGNAFRDYGEYEETPPQTEPTDAAIPLGDYEVGGFEEDDDISLEDEAPPPEKPKKKHHRRIIPLYIKVLLYLVIVGTVAVGLGYGIWECAKDVLAFGRSEERLEVVIHEGDTVEDIAKMLKEKGVIKYPWLFKLYCGFTDSGDSMKPDPEGKPYSIYYNYDYHALVSELSPKNKRETVRITIPEGWNAAQIFTLMESNGICSVADLEDCAANTTFEYWFLEEIPYGEANRLEGFLFPDTYDFYADDDPEAVLDKLLSNFNEKFSENAQAQLEVLNTTLTDRLAANGYEESYIQEHLFTVYDLITVASMIEKETDLDEERSLVASVIYNRLCSKDFPCLQIDATVVYALGGVDDDGQVTYEDLEVDSPYNTYKVEGLPIGPISNPGLASITAALYPSETNYYFYVLEGEEHRFSETLEQHNNP